MSVDSVAGPPTRRERQRRQTLAEIKTRAVDQVAAGGAESVSLNAIARAMGMSPAALYRYFASRDALLAELVADAYGSLADALTQAAARAGGDPGALAAVAHAYRDWALAHPNSYRLIFQTPSGSGLDLEPERIVAAAQRSMDVILSALSGAAGADARPGADRPGRGLGAALAGPGPDRRAAVPGPAGLDPAARPDQPGAGAAPDRHRRRPRAALPGRGAVAGPDGPLDLRTSRLS